MPDAGLVIVADITIWDNLNILQRRVLRHGCFELAEQLRQDVEGFIRWWNRVIPKFAADDIELRAPEGDPFPRARLQRVTSQYWSLEMPIHTGRWQKTPFRGLRNAVLTMLIESFPWTLQPFDQP